MATTDVDGAHHQRMRVSGAEASVFAEIMNPDGRVKVELPAGASGLSDAELRASSLDVRQVSGSVNSVSVTNASIPVTVASSLEVKQVSGSVDSVSITNASIPVTGTFYQATQPVSGTIRPIQVRGSLRTAYVAIANGTETTLLAGTASEFNDLIWLMAANTSTAAGAAGTGSQLDIRSTTGGQIVASLYVENKSTVVFHPAVPIPMNTAADTWTVDMNDIKSTMTISALFSREV